MIEYTQSLAGIVHIGSGEGVHPASFPHADLILSIHAFSRDVSHALTKLDSMACATQNKKAPSLRRLRHDTLAPWHAFDTQYSKGRTSLEQTKAPRSAEQNYGAI